MMYRSTWKAENQHCTRILSSAQKRKYTTVDLNLVLNLDLQLHKLLRMVRVLYGMVKDVNEQKLGYYYEPSGTLCDFLDLVAVSVRSRYSCTTRTAVENKNLVYW